MFIKLKYKVLFDTVDLSFSALDFSFVSTISERKMLEMREQVAAPEAFN
jgi:hypothetical protein